MRPPRWRQAGGAALLLAGLAGCTAPGWTARQVILVRELNKPESVVVDPATGTGYVANVVARTEGTGSARFWAKDGTGFIASLKPGGLLHQYRWAESSPKAPLHSVKGMCILDGVLYAADIDRVVRYSVGTGQAMGPIEIPGAKRLNDMATDGQDVYVSDTATSTIYRLRGDEVEELKAPEGVNGITFWQGKMFAVSWPHHEIYELDPNGKREPRPFGLAGHFRTLDGIEVLPDGSFVVSDFEGDRVYWVGTDRRTVAPLVKAQTPADIGLDRERMLLFVPWLMGDRVTVHVLEKR
ncbi:MAG: hypothetical protein ACLF0G_17015 [Candidatus Brocadiia bacterium]